MTNRRSFLAAASAIGALPLAGCISDSDILDGDENTTPEDDEEPTENGTDEDQQNDEEENGSEDEETPTEEDGGDEEGSEEEGSDEEETDEEETDEEEPDENEGDELADLPGETIDDFEDVDAWSPIIGQEEVTGEDEEAYAGTTSARIRVPEDDEEATVYRAFPDGLDLSDRGISIAVKYTGLEQFDLTVQLLAGDVRNRIDLRRILTGAADRWQRVDLGIEMIEGDPDLEAVREIRIVGRRRGDEEGEIDFVVDDLRAAESPDQGAVMLLFDGGLDSHYSTAFEGLREFDFRGVEAVTPEAIGNDGRLTIEDLEEMSEAGWDVISRPRTGSQFLHEYSPEQQEGLIRRSQGFLENRGFEDGARHFLTPRNLLSPESHDLVREYHEQAFRFGGGPNSLPITDHYNLGFFSGGAGTASTDYIDLAAAYNQLAVLHFVYVDDDDEGVDEQYLKNMLEYIDNQDVQVVTASDLLDSDPGELAGGSSDGDTDEGANNESNDTDDDS